MRLVPRHQAAPLLVMKLCYIFLTLCNQHLEPLSDPQTHNFMEIICNTYNSIHNSAAVHGNNTPNNLLETLLKTISCSSSENQGHFPIERLRSTAGDGYSASDIRRMSPQFEWKPIKKRKYACNQCNAEYKLLGDLNHHTLNIHHSYRCMFCGVKFSRRWNLERHSLRHVGFKPFECGVCDRPYKRKDHLMRHMNRRHPGVDASKNIRVFLTSSESLNYLRRLQTEKVVQAIENVERISSREQADWGHFTYLN